MTQDEIIEMAIEARLAFDSEEYPEIWQTYMNVGKQEIEAFAKLVAAKEREALAQTQEPVAWREFIERVAKQKPEKPDYWSSCSQCERNIYDAEDLLEATPPQRKPLTDEQLDDIYYCVEGGATALETWRQQVRAIEAAHGIKENT